jgi:hypothetical protein
MEGGFQMTKLCSLVVAFMMMFFGGWNWFLALTGFTVIEFFATRLPDNDPRKIRKQVKLFGNNNIKDNLYIIFGTRTIWRMFLPSIRPLEDLTNLQVESSD